MQSSALDSGEMRSSAFAGGGQAELAEGSPGTAVRAGAEQAAARARATLSGQMRRLAGLEAEQERLLTELDRRMEEVKAGYSLRLNALQRGISHKRAQIEELLRARRAELLPSGARSVKTLYGRAGFRTVPPQVIIAPEAEEEEACRLLRRRGLARYVRVRCSADRAGLGGAVRAGELGEGILAACGLRLTPPRDSFYCVLDSAAAAGARSR